MVVVVYVLATLAYNQFGLRRRETVCWYEGMKVWAPVRDIIYQ